MDAGLLASLFDYLAAFGPTAVIIGALVLILFKQQEKTIDRIERQQVETIERIEAKNDKIVETLQEEKTNYYSIVQEQGTILHELKTIVERQEENQNQMAASIHSQAIQLEVIKTQIEYANR